MSQCKQPIPWFGSYVDSWKIKKGRAFQEKDQADLVACQDWHLAYHKGKQVKKDIYRVEIKQSAKDLFKSHIYAPTFLKAIKDLLLN